MSDELKPKEGEVDNESEGKKSEAADENHDWFETVGSRKFDLATPEGRRDLKNFQDGLSYTAGNNARIRGELEKEVEPLRKYNLKSATVDEVSVMKEVARHREEGDHESADRLLWELYSQQKSETNIVLERERFWEDYKRQNPDIFEVLPEDMAKDYVFKNYSTDIQETDNPFELVDRVLKPKAAKFKPKMAVPDEGTLPATVLGKGGSSATPPVRSDESEDSEEGSWDKLMDEMGVK